MSFHELLEEPTPDNRETGHEQHLPAPPKQAHLTDTVLTKTAKRSSAHMEMTGNRYADEGLACDGGRHDADCFLDASTRQRVVSLFHARVGAAHLAYMGALSQLGVEELLKKEPNESDLIMELLLDVIGAVTSTVALKIFKLAVGGHHAIHDVITSAADVGHGLQQHGDEVFKEGVLVAVSLGKKGYAEAHGAHDVPAKPGAATEKAANVGFIDMLKDQSGAVFEHIREGLIAGIDDARLLVLFDSFRAVNHRVSVYKEALSQKLQRFKRSGLAKIGVSMNDQPKYRGYGYGLDAAWQHEKHAYWVNLPTGRRLGLYRRPHVPARETVREVSGLDRPKRQFEILADEMQRGTNEEGFVFDGFVAPEFVDAAVAMHAARWGYQPRERVAGPYEMMQMGDERQ